MSIIRCEQCERQLDSDFVEFHSKKEVCIDCFNEMRGDEEPDYDVENYFEKQKRELEND